MQSLFDKFGLTATYVLSAIVIVVLLLVLLLIMRALFSRRVRPAGGRARQPRLGVVDAFDIDRQRQLVLVRRDNVEHLIMIGGPNDVVVESAIVRGGEVRPSEGRRQPLDETAVALAPPAAPVAAPGPVPPQAPVIPAAPPAPVRAPAPLSTATPPPMPPLRQPVAPPPPPLRQPVAPPQETPDVAPQVRSSAEAPAVGAAPPVAPAPAPAPVGPPAPRLPPRVVPPPRSPSPPPLARPPGAAGLGSGVSPRSSAPSPQPLSQAPSVQPPRQDNGASGAARRFEFGRTPPRPASEPSKPDEQDAAKPAGEDAQSAGSPPAPGSAVPEPSKEGPAKLPDAGKAADPLDALEEEMAKLLGRPPGQS